MQRNMPFGFFLLLFLSISTYSFGQDERITDRILYIKIQQPGSDKVENIKMYREEAVNFDVKKFLADNPNASIEIGGRQVRDHEVIKYSFNNSALLASDEYYLDRCTKFCPTVVSHQETALLGVATHSSDDSEGIRITRVIPESSADKAGLRENDVILDVNGMDILSGCDLRATINLLPIGANATIQFLRNDKEELTYATLGYKHQKIMSWEPCCDEEDQNVYEFATEIEEKAATKLQVYPNPSKGVFQLSFNSTEEYPVTYYVSDATGKEIFRKEIKAFKGNFQKNINLSNMAEGIYFLHAIQNEWTSVKKLVIQRP